MKTAIISPHTDDAIFSLGFFMRSVKNVTIISPMAGIPKDDAGLAKHTLLRKEHGLACEKIGANYINGDFLDDVYEGLDHSVLQDWIIKKTESYDTIIFPLGIHHPDHIIVSDICIGLQQLLPFSLKTFYIYCELPYRTLYPEITDEKLRLLNVKKSIQCIPDESKKEICKVYASQVDEKLLQQLQETEILYKI